MAERPPIAGGILAGGRARRLGGRDKGLITLDGRPLVAWVIERLRPQVDALLINANRHRDRYAALGHPVVPDRLEGFQGPLAGIAALLEASPHDWLLIVPCDTPRLPADLAERLWQARERQDAPAAVASDGTRRHHAHALLSRTLLPALLDHLDHGGRRLGEWLANQHPGIADFSDQPDAFANINTPEDLAALASDVD